MLQRRGDIDGADAKFQEIVGAFPKNPDAWQSYGRFLRSTGKIVVAIDVFQKALRLGGRGSVLVGLASAYLIAENRSAAVEYFAKYLEKTVDGVELSRLSGLFGSRGETDSAIAGLERALQLSGPDDPDAASRRFELGNLYLSRLDHLRAIPHIKKVLDVDPNSMARSEER